MFEAIIILTVSLAFALVIHSCFVGLVFMNGKFMKAYVRKTMEITKELAEESLENVMNKTEDHVNMTTFTENL